MRFRTKVIFSVAEFICGFFFFVIGVALLVYNKQLVQRSQEFYPRDLSPKEINIMDIMNRFLCVLVGLKISITGFLIVLNSTC